MRTLTFVVALLASQLSGPALAAPMPPLVLHDLNDATHMLPTEWTRGGVLIFAFAHDARDQMDQWVSALGLGDDQTWFEAPVVGAVPAMVRPMIRGGMRSRYGGARRGHLAPVFDDAEAVSRIVGTHGAVVVLAIDGSGAVAARVDGAPSDEAIRTIQAALPH